MHVPGYGDATVEGCPPIGPYAGKVRVRYADGSMYHVNPEDLAAPQEPTQYGTPHAVDCVVLMSDEEATIACSVVEPPADVS